MTASMEIGGMDSNYLGGEVTYLNTYSDWYWGPVANTIYYNNQLMDSNSPTPDAANLASGNYKMAVLDTGTSTM